MLVLCWASAVDNEATVKQHWLSAPVGTTDMRSLNNARIILGQRCRRCASISTALAQHHSILSDCSQH